MRERRQRERERGNSHEKLIGEKSRVDRQRFLFVWKREEFGFNKEREPEGGVRGFSGGREWERGVF